MTGKKILIVEDEGIPALELENKLVTMGCIVVGSVRSGEAAVEAALDSRPDVVLMGIRLKGKMDGIEAARKIQESTDIPVVYLTAYSDARTRERASRTKLYWYLQKPYFFDVIRSTIEEATGIHLGQQSPIPPNLRVE